MAPESDSDYRKLGEVSINDDAFELDLKINEGYQAYSAELLRLALLILTGLSIVWLKLYLPSDPPLPRPGLRTTVLFLLAFASTALAAGAALIHRYTAADSLAYQLTALRRRARNRPAQGDRPSDAELAKRQEAKRNALFQWSSRLLRISAWSLFAGLVLLCLSVASLMF